jgi:hypothetical protein
LTDSGARLLVVEGDAAPASVVTTLHVSDIAHVPVDPRPTPHSDQSA